MAGLDPAIPLIEARPCHMIGIAGSSPAMTAVGFNAHCATGVGRNKRSALRHPRPQPAQ
jgi:hypothetical protein